MNSVLSSVLFLPILLTISIFIQVSLARSCASHIECWNIEEMCIDGTCQVPLIDIPCEHQFDCIKFAQFCINQKCQTPKLGDTCNSILDCHALDICKDGKCVYFECENIYEKFIHGTCQVPRIDGPCENPTHCVEFGQSCINQRCANPIISDPCLNCPFPAICEDGKCAESIQNNSTNIYIICLIIGIVVLIAIIVVIVIFYVKHASTASPNDSLSVNHPW